MWKLGLRPRSFFSGSTQIVFSLQCTVCNCNPFSPLPPGQFYAFGLRDKSFLLISWMTYREEKMLHYITRNFLPKINNQFTIHDNDFSFFTIFIKHNFPLQVFPWWPPFFCFTPLHNLQIHSIRRHSTWKTEYTAVYLIYITMTILKLSASWDWSCYILHYYNIFTQCLHILSMDN